MYQTSVASPGARPLRCGNPKSICISLKIREAMVDDYAFDG
jgi:hypothetical protein